MYKQALKVTTVLIGIIISGQASIYAGLISDMNNTYVSAKEKTALKNIFSKDNIGNIYLNYLESASAEENVSGVEAIDTIYKQYSSLEQCQINQKITKERQSIKKSDIINILLQNGVSVPGANNPEKIPNIGTKNLTESCTSVMTCLGQDSIKNCTSIVTETYKKYKKQIIKKEEATSNLYGSQFFNNGSLDDSAYDLLVDMKNIGDIMFNNNKEPATIKFYTLPAAQKASKTPGKKKNSNNNKRGKKNTTKNDTEKKDDKNTEDTNNKESIKNNNSNKKGKEDTIGEDIKTKNKNTAGSKRGGNNPEIEEGGGNLFGNTDMCKDTNEDEETEDNETEGEDDIIEKENELRQEYIANINKIYDGYNPAEEIRNNQDGNDNDQGSGDGDGEEGTPKSKMDGLKDKEKITKCVNTCKEKYQGLGNNNRLICEAKCLCEVIEPKKKNKYIDYKMKFCRIPSKGKTVSISTIKVSSLEEILDNINAILKKLRQSGKLHKRNKTEEYLDTSLENFSFADSFIFSFNAGTKASLKEKSKEQKEKEAKKMFEESIEGSMTYSGEKNKYANYKKKTQVTTGRSHNPNTEIAKSISDRQEILGQSLQQLDEFRKNMNLKLMDIETISQSMKQKAENGK